jgi:hypothetical protein
MSEHVWSYQSESLIGTTSEVGPITETQILAAARAGKLKSETLVMSPTRTRGGWMQVKQIGGLMQAIAAGAQERQVAKEQADREKATAHQAATAQRQVDAANRQMAAQADATARDRERQQYSQISDCPNIDLVKTICDRVRGILTSQETLQYVAIQSKPLMNISPDAMVATNRRLIFYRPKLLGRFEFQDYQWIDVGNAHIQQNLLGAVFTARHISGQVLSMDYLPKEAAQAIYRLSQEREEAARLHRQQLHLEHARAGAMQVNVGMPAAPTAPAPVASPPQNDLLQRMQTLKTMLDQGLIDQADFNARKKEILASV